MTTHSSARLARSRTKIKRAWLLTWEHATHRPSGALNRFVAIVSSRYSDTRVRTILEQYYVSNYLSIPEQFSYVKSKEHCPYKVQHCTVAVLRETSTGRVVATSGSIFRLDDHWGKSLALGTHCS